MQEEFYLEQNVAKAIRIDEFSGDALTTSLVDDVFFILQKVGQRSLTTASVQCVCAVLTQLNSLLAADLRLALDSRWKVRLGLDCALLPVSVIYTVPCSVALLVWTSLPAVTHFMHFNIITW